MKRPEDVVRDIVEGKEYGFVVYSQSTCRPPRNPASLASQGGRLDIVSRVLLASLYHGGTVRDDVFLLAYIRDKSTECTLLLGFTSKCLPRTMYCEDEASRLLIDTVYGSSKCPRLEGISFQWLLKTLNKHGYRVLILLEDGRQLLPRDLQGRIAYVLGSNVDPPPVQGFEKVSLGPVSLLASTVVVLINAYRALVKAGILPEGL